LFVAAQQTPSALLSYYAAHHMFDLKTGIFAEFLD